MMHRRNMAWGAWAFLLLLFLMPGAEPASAQTPEGQPDVTDVDPTTVMIQISTVDDQSNVFPALPGGGDSLWQGDPLVFPMDTDGSSTDGVQVYRSVAASLQAAPPERHVGTAEVTVSVRVTNDGPNAGLQFSGRFIMVEPGDPALWFERLHDLQTVEFFAPVGHVETLTLSAPVPAEDLAAGDVLIHLALETYHSADGESGNPGTQWTADQFLATYAFDTTGCEPQIAIDKTGSGPDPLVVGEIIDYSFLVSNTGNVSLSNITVTDPLPGLSPIACPGDTLAPGAEMTCTATYTVTQEDVDAGMIENTATVTGQPPGGLPPPSDEGSTTFPPDQNSGISIEKSGSGPDPLTVGATIEYSFVVANTGNVTVTDVTVTDPLPGLSPIDCPGTTLAPGAEMTCTATYEVTQADVDAGVVENTATASGQTPTGGPPPTDTSTTTVPPTPPVPAVPPPAFVLLLALLATATLWTLRRARG